MKQTKNYGVKHLNQGEYYIDRKDPAKTIIYYNAFPEDLQQIQNLSNNYMMRSEPTEYGNFGERKIIPLIKKCIVLSMAYEEILDHLDQKQYKQVYRET